MSSAGPSAPISSGTQLGGRYRLRAPIGRGGVGQVWEADDTRLDRRVAVKTLAHEVDAELQRFEREVRTLANLNHPSIVTIHDAGEHQGTAYLVMELVEGVSLAEALANGALDVDRAVAIAVSVADGLAAAHSAGVIHRDVKPGNILLADDGRAKLADFGIARLAEATTTITMVGTAAYLAPEQLEGAQLTHAVDVYSLGLVLLEMATGQKAFPGTAPAAAYARLQRDPDVPEDLPRELRQLITDMTARDTADRPAAADVAERLRERPANDATLPLGDATRTVPIGPTPTPLPEQGSAEGASRSVVEASHVRATLRRWWDSATVRRAAVGVAIVLAAALVIVALPASPGPGTTGDGRSEPDQQVQQEPDQELQEPDQELPEPLQDSLRGLEREINR